MSKHITTLGTDDAGAVFSEPNHDYRYLLWRRLSTVVKETCLFIMLNPSVANHQRLDPTVSKCIHWTKEWGFGRIEVANIFAYVSTDPMPIKKGYDWIVGPHNDEYIGEAIDRAARVVVAWGANGTVMERGQVIIEMLRERQRSAYCFGVTKGNNQPRHPLYIGYKTKLIEYERALHGASI